MVGLAPKLPAKRQVYVADREADMMALMARAQGLACSVDWLVRDVHNRYPPDSEKLWSHTTQGEPLDQVEFALAARIVRQHLWGRRVELSAGKNKMVNATCVVAREYDAPAGIKPIEWPLLTNRVAADAAAVSELIRWYWAHCEIEMLFNVFKNGCRVEALQLGAIKRIERAPALYLVSWRIAHLMRRGRTCPDLPASLFFAPNENQAAYLINKALPPRAPALNEVMRRIARPGGFLARKRDGEPEPRREGREVRRSRLCS